MTLLPRPRSCLDQGYGAEYGELVEKLRGLDMLPCDMGKWLQALKLCVSHLDEDCGLLVAATLVGGGLTAEKDGGLLFSSLLL